VRALAPPDGADTTQIGDRNFRYSAGDLDSIDGDGIRWCATARADLLQLRRRHLDLAHITHAARPATGSSGSLSLADQDPPLDSLELGLRPTGTQPPPTATSTRSSRRRWACGRVVVTYFCRGYTIHARRVQGRPMTGAPARWRARRDSRPRLAGGGRPAHLRQPPRPIRQLTNHDQPGRHVTFFNGDVLDDHSVTANASGRDRPSAVRLRRHPSGAEAPVAGVESLGAGSYQFYCTVHAFMRGTITVTGAGTPAPRPPDTTPARPRWHCHRAPERGQAKAAGCAPHRHRRVRHAPACGHHARRARRVTLARGTLNLTGPGQPHRPAGRSPSPLAARFATADRRP